MGILKKNGFWRTIPLIAIAALLTCTLLVVRTQRHHPEKNAPQTNDTQPPNPAPHPSASIPAKHPAAAPATAGHAPPSQLTPQPSAPPRHAHSPGAHPASAPAAPATLSARQRATYENIPSPRFREDLLKLTPPARARALKTLASNPVPDADYDSLHLTTKGMLYYACRLLPADAAQVTPGELSAPSASLPAAAPVAITQPPIRHSRPGARRVLFLDFGGMDITDTAWNEAVDYGKIATYRARPYDTDGDETTFNDTEQRAIIDIWERVAENFAPFDVDVTTEKPAPPTRTTGRALVTNSIDRDGKYMPAISATSQTAGVALRNVFGEPDYATEYSPALIYYNKLSNTANIAYAVSHELGHNLGLSHDGPGVTLGDGDDHGYYTGHGADATSWAPIMGAGYGKNVIQWSKGEYYNANNHEDDLAIIEGKLGYRPNLAATTLDTALDLTPTDTGHLGATGIIRHANDTHYYALNLTNTGTVAITVTPNTLSSTGNIAGSADLGLAIVDPSDRPDYSDNPQATTYVTLRPQLAAGQWYLRVTTGGAGFPMQTHPTGYTAYGAIGQYTLTANLIQANPTLATALNSNLTWTTEPGSAAAWFGQAATSHDGIAAAQCTFDNLGQSAGIATTVEGPGTLSFWWKLAATDYDDLAFFTSETTDTPPTLQTSCSGQKDWERHTLTINTTGTHHFIWILNRASLLENPNPAVFFNAWLDQVTWTPADLTFTTAPATQEVAPGPGQFTIAIENNKTWTATTDAPWLTLSATTGNGNATLSIAHATNDTLRPRRATLAITSAGITRTCEITQPTLIPFATALDNTLPWTTGGDAPWTTQTITTHDGRHATRSGIIFGATAATGTLSGEETWLKTTVNGPGTINFWWKVSSEAEETDNTGTWGDILHFTADGTEHARTSGEKDWTQRTIAITGDGAHELKWRYKKDPYLSAAGDAAWLDQVTWISGATLALGITPNTSHVAAPGGQFTATVNANINWNATSSATWLTITPGSGAGPGALTIRAAANYAATTRTGTITITGDGLADTCVVTQAPATTGTSTSSNNNKGGGGGGAPSLWLLGALSLLLLIRAKRSK